MFIVGVVNLKGGCGKTTLATHLAARYAREGHRSILGDLDRQQSAIRWVERRPPTLPSIEASELDVDGLLLPFGEGRMVIDVPAGLRRKALEVVVHAVDALVVPVLPSAFDEGGTERFFRLAGEMKPVRRGRRPIALVPNRVRPGVNSERRLDAWLAERELRAVARISDAQHYVTAAASSVTLFDQPPTRVRRLLGEWAPLLTFLDGLSEKDDPVDRAAG